MNQMITSVTSVDEVSLVSLIGLPPQSGVAAVTLEMVAKIGINVDMITYAEKPGGTTDLSFTLPDADIAKLIAMTAPFRTKHPNIAVSVNSGNCKLIAYGPGMREHTGVAAALFSALTRIGVPFKLVTTSEVDISVLVDAEHAGCLSALKKELGI